MSDKRKMTSGDPAVDELNGILKSFLAKHPSISGLCAVGIRADGGQYLIAAQAADPRTGAVPFDPTTLQQCLCEAIAWNRAVARDMHLKKAVPKASIPESVRRH